MKRQSRNRRVRERWLRKVERIVLDYSIKAWLSNPLERMEMSDFSEWLKSLFDE